ncbi:GTP cyclohydrolase 1 [Beta vulgaris subsp. vulgaris]|uniref:GTP cyclohydrolase 1 n=1 Tax=Beta vulgaris subsp. vulgaris TaxID=3555 RepID=UPI00203678E3|nr:GTP cyclohydrolase 1 [Beta vulgaris subsp. vulgaris]XP_010682111.2 GTP cyclohydrolase 1 [Beta vulgaris subsp. vulgaris]
MGALDEGHYDVELENALKLCCNELGREEEPEIEGAVRTLLQGLGEDINREGIKKTPLRVARALRHGTRGYRLNVKEIVQGALFPEAGLDNCKIGHGGGAGGLVIVRDLDLFSYCESCLLPFQVKCQVGYVPSGQRVVGLSKLSRVADVFAKRLQDPQRLADEICSTLQHVIKPAGVAVILQCRHIHFPSLESMFFNSLEGWTKLLVSSGSGVFEDEDSIIWSEFLSLLKFRDFIADRSRERNSFVYWCPARASPISKISSSSGTVNHGMVSAVTSILKSLGEDPLRKELIDTPVRFVKWLMNFQNCNLDMKLNTFAPNESVPLKSDGDLKLDAEIHSEVNLSFWSQCEHHLLPFYGVVHIGYLCAKGVIPLRKALAQSIVHFYGFKLQVQERLTRQIAETVAPLVGGDIIVVAEASHTCMISRGIEKFGSSTTTVAVLGRFSSDPIARALFLESLPSTNNF